MNEEDLREKEKALRNAAYLAKLKEGFEQIRRGEVIVKTMEELRAMEEDEPCNTQS